MPTFDLRPYCCLFPSPGSFSSFTVKCSNRDSSPRVAMMSRSNSENDPKISAQAVEYIILFLFSMFVSLAIDDVEMVVVVVVVVFHLGFQDLEINTISGSYLRSRRGNGPYPTK